MYVQDDWRASSKLTLNLGARWDVYPPWLEVDDRQSNFDVTTGAFVARVRRRDHRRRRRRAAACRRIRRATSGRGSVSRTTCKATARPSSEAATASSGTSRPAAPRRRRRRTRRSCSRRRSRRRRCRRPASTCSSRTACRRRPASIRASHRPATRGRSSTPISVTRYAQNFNVNVQRAFGANYLVEAAYVGLARPADGPQGRHQPGAAGRRRQRCERQPSVHHAGAGMRSMSQAQSIGKIDHNALLLKFQRRFANNFSFLNSYTFGKTLRLRVGQRGRDQTIYDLGVQLGLRRLRRAAHVQLELDLRAAVGDARLCTAAGRSTASCTCARACRSPWRRTRTCARPAPPTGRTRRATAS